MKVQIVSDIHLKFISNSLKPFKVAAPNLILAGDITNRYDPELLNKYFSLLSPLYRKIYYVPGNHEYFSRTYDHQHITKELEKICRNHNNIEFLYNRTLMSNSIAIFGAPFPTKHLKQEHELSKTALQKFLNLPQRRCLIITHYAPLLTDVFHPKWTHQPSLPRFCFDGLSLIPPGLNKEITWIFGHTHYACDFVRNNVRFISNPVRNENRLLPFDETKTINID